MDEEKIEVTEKAEKNSRPGPKPGAVYHPANLTTGLKQVAIKSITVYYYGAPVSFDITLQSEAQARLLIRKSAYGLRALKDGKCEIEIDGIKKVMEDVQ